MAYNLDFLKAKMNGKASGGGNFKKLTFWKPDVGDHEIRVLPYEDSNKQPCQEVVYYTKLDDFTRFVAPHTFGMEDPIDIFKKKLFEEKLQKGDPKRKLFSICSEKQRYYFLLIDRKNEDAGPQLWEVSDDTAKQIFGILTHKDNEDENIFDADVGYDFTVSVQPDMENGKPKFWNGKPCKTIKVIQRKKPSKLHKDATIAAKWLGEMPQLEQYFKAQVKPAEKMEELLEAAIVALTDKMSQGTPTGPTSASKTPSIAPPDDVDAAFKDL